MSYFTDLSVAFDNFSSIDSEESNWEWRICSKLNEDDARSYSSLSLKQSPTTQIHLLGADSMSSITICDDTLRIRSLDIVDEHGVELWRTTLSEAFPLRRDSLDFVRVALGASREASVRGDRAATFVFDILRVLKSVRVVQATHQVFRFSVNECMANVEFITIGGCVYGCVVLRHSDPQLLNAAVHDLGFADSRNQDVPALVKAIMDDSAGRRVSVCAQLEPRGLTS